MSADRSVTVTWADMTAAGIDTDRVEPTREGREGGYRQWALTFADERLVFGEYAGPDAYGGWDSCAEEWVSHSATGREGVWQSYSAPEWYATPAEMLADVAAWQRKMSGEES